MNGLALELATLVVLVAFLFFFSVIDVSISRLSRLSLRVLVEKERSPRRHLLEPIAADRTRFLLPIHLACQVLLVIVAVLTVSVFMDLEFRAPALWSVLAAMAANILFRQLLPHLLTQSAPEQVLLRVLPFFGRPYRLLCWISAPLTILLKAAFKPSQGKVALAEGMEEEAGEEEIQAYLGVGEEEGIFEQEESALIQSALEFSDTLVREIMTPRTEIVAIEENATVSELKDLIVSSKFSRIPVYRERIDQIEGVVYVRNLLGYLADGRGDDPITPLINKPWFVPETKKVSKLLKEMQRSAEHLALVISEYGSVSGLVTTEDVIEEIVGEIRDEDELERVDLTYEGKGIYLVRGGADIEELEKTLDVDLGEPDVTTVSGLIVAHLGKVPAPGETVVLDGIQVEILSSDRKKIQSMRIRKLGQMSPQPATGSPGSSGPSSAQKAG